VIDPYHRVWNYPNLHVIDGSTLTANLGVNPSLTIVAQAERAISLWPNKGESDPRPSQGERYRRLEPIAPKEPIVPNGAIGELR
jgi:cholesterol oxidase